MKGKESTVFISGGMHTFPSQVKLLGKTFADVDALTGLLGRFYWVTPKLITSAQRKGRHGNLENTFFSGLSRSPGHCIDIFYDMLSNKLTFKAQVKHQLTFEYVTSVQDDIRTKLNDLKQKLSGFWTIEDGPHGLGGQEIRVYFVDNNALEFIDAQGKPFIHNIVWAYFLSNPDL